jgi:uncharacterized iron-regulated membrane protein
MIDRGVAARNALEPLRRTRRSVYSPRDAGRDRRPSREFREVTATPPSAWQRWVRRPQQLWFRRALFQVHLWVALAVGVYIVFISVTGSAVVLRPQANIWFVPRTVPSTAGTRLTGDALRAAAERVYAGEVIADVREARRPDRPASVYLLRNGKEVERLFDQYAAVDMGLAYPPVVRAMEWLVDLHDNLLGGETGRAVNGIGGALTALLIMTGAVLWWPGRGRWTESLSFGRPAKSRRFAWQLHSAIGFWTFALLLVWALTAVYFAFPWTAELLMDLFDDNLDDAARPGEAFLIWIVQVHFGRFGGMFGRVAWIVLGLLPAVLFVTGFIMWWTRVVRRRAAVARGEARIGAAADAAAQAAAAE